MSYLNRTFSTIDTKYVTWTTETLDSDGASFPGPGTFGVDTVGFGGCILPGTGGGGTPVSIPYTGALQQLVVTSGETVLGSLGVFDPTEFNDPDIVFSITALLSTEPGDTEGRILLYDMGPPTDPGGSGNLIAQITVANEELNQLVTKSVNIVGEAMANEARVYEVRARIANFIEGDTLTIEHAAIVAKGSSSGGGGGGGGEARGGPFLWSLTAPANSRTFSNWADLYAAVSAAPLGEHIVQVDFPLGPGQEYHVTAGSWEVTGWRFLGFSGIARPEIYFDDGAEFRSIVSLEFNSLRLRQNSNSPVFLVSNIAPFPYMLITFEDTVSQLDTNVPLVAVDNGQVCDLHIRNSLNFTEQAFTGNVTSEAITIASGGQCSYIIEGPGDIGPYVFGGTGTLNVFPVSANMSSPASFPHFSGSLTITYGDEAKSLAYDDSLVNPPLGVTTVQEAIDAVKSASGNVLFQARTLSDWDTGAVTCNSTFGPGQGFEFGANNQPGQFYIYGNNSVLNDGDFCIIPISRSSFAMPSQVAGGETYYRYTIEMQIETTNFRGGEVGLLLGWDVSTRTGSGFTCATGSTTGTTGVYLNGSQFVNPSTFSTPPVENAVSGKTLTFKVDVTWRNFGAPTLSQVWMKYELSGSGSVLSDNIVWYNSDFNSTDPIWEGFFPDSVALYFIHHPSVFLDGSSSFLINQFTVRKYPNNEA